MNYLLLFAAVVTRSKTNKVPIVIYFFAVVVFLLYSSYHRRQLPLSVAPAGIEGRGWGWRRRGSFYYCIIGVCVCVRANAARKLHSADILYR